MGRRYNGHGYKKSNPKSQVAQSILWSEIGNLDEWFMDNDLFIDKAQQIATILSNDKKYRDSRAIINTNSQLRQFYEEFVMAADNRENVAQAVFSLSLLQPKIAYRTSKGSIGVELDAFLNGVIQFIRSAKNQEEALFRGKLLFEAVYGFYGEKK